MENPFGDDQDARDARKYLVLVSAKENDYLMLQKVLKNIQEHVDSSARPLWIDSRGAGIFLCTDMPAWEIRHYMLEEDKMGQLDAMKDFLVVQIGPDWSAKHEAKTEHWLSTHLGTPSSGPAVKYRRRGRG